MGRSFMGRQLCVRWRHSARSDAPSCRGRQPDALEHKRLAMADPLRQASEAAIGLNHQSLQFRCTKLQLTIADLGLGPVGNDRGRLALPASCPATDRHWWTCTPS